MLRVENVFKNYGGLAVLQGVSLTLARGDRLAVVGRNGSGKSTLLRIIAGVDSPEAGQVALLSGQSLAYLPQDARVDPGRTVHHEALAGFTEVLALEARQQELELRMAEAGDQPERLMPLVEEHAHVLQRLEQLGAYTLEAEVGRVLAGLGFRQEDHQRPVEQLSGGWQMRVALARALVQHPDVLLLDEPTNHLDLAATEWLESYLSQYPGAVLLVSHDRYLLNAVCTRFVELEVGRAAEYSGNYNAYLAARDQRQAQQRRAFEQQQELIARQQTFIDRNRAGQKHAQAKSREKTLARLERVERPHQAPSARFRFPPCHHSEQEVATLKGVEKRYAERNVFSGVGLALERGDRVAVIGPNGSGKSTLLRLLAEREPPSRGSLQLGQHVALGYYGQDQAELHGNGASVLEEVYQAAPGWTLEQTRSLLGQLLFSQEEAFKAVAALSGGERARVALAGLLLRPSNLLVLDEPTNHLDLATREAVETALRAYPGTLVFATHDRYLVEQLADSVWEVADGRVRVYRGNYSACRRSQEAAQRAVAAQVQQPSASEPRRSPRRPPRDDRTLDRDLTRVEAQITAVEAALVELEQALANPAGYGDAEQVAELGVEYASRQAELEVLTRRWEELFQKAEARNQQAG